MSFVDIGVLVDDGITRVVPDELDRHIELIFAAYAVAQGGHLRSTHDGIRPAEAGDLRFHRIFRQRHAFDGDGVGRFARAAVTAVNADVAGQDRQHGDGPGRLLPVSLTLRAPALANVGRFRRTDFTGQLNDAFGRDARYARRPIRSFRGFVITLAENIGFVMTISWCAFRQGFFVITHAVFIEERLIDQIFINQHPRNTCHQRGIGARTNRDPLVFTPCGSVGITRIDNDHPRV